MKKINTLLVLTFFVFLTSCSKTNNSTTEHTHNYNVELVTEKNKNSEATCKNKATYFYYCSCGEMGSETFEYGSLDPNNHEGEASWVISETTHKKTYECCGKVVVEESEHTGGVSTCSSYAHCTVCGEEYGELGNHFYTKVVDEKYLRSKATCKDLATYYYSCKCGEVSPNSFTYGEVDPNNHTGYLTYEVIDSSTHKAMYTCCGESKVENHALKEDKCTLCEYEEKTSKMLSENEWNAYVKSLNTLEKVSHVKMNSEETRTSPTSLYSKRDIITDISSNMMRYTTKLIDEDSNVETDGYVLNKDGKWITYYKPDGSSVYYKDILDDKTSILDAFASELFLNTYIFYVPYSDLKYSEETNSYEYTLKDDTETYIYTYYFVNNELDKVTINKNAYDSNKNQEVKTNSTIKYEFNTPERVSLPLQSLGGEKIEDYSSYLDRLTSSDLLKNFELKTSSIETNYEESGAIFSKITKNTNFITDAPKKLSYESTSSMDNKGYSFNESQKYTLYQDEEPYKESKYDFDTNTWGEFETTSTNYSTYEEYVKSKVSDLIKVDENKFSDERYNEIYDAYQIGYTFYVFKDGLLISTQEYDDDQNEYYDKLEVNQYYYNVEELSYPTKE